MTNDEAIDVFTRWGNLLPQGDTLGDEDIDRLSEAAAGLVPRLTDAQAERLMRVLAGRRDTEDSLLGHVTQRLVSMIETAPGFTLGGTAPIIGTGPELDLLRERRVNSEPVLRRLRPRYGDRLLYAAAADPPLTRVRRLRELGEGTNDDPRVGLLLDDIVSSIERSPMGKFHAQDVLPELDWPDDLRLRLARVVGAS